VRPPAGPLLVLDAGSPLSSVAVAADGRLLASVELDRRVEKGDLLSAISAALASAGLERKALRGVVTLRGPGSFTGLRIGGSLALGLSRGLAVPAGSVSTFDGLALAASDPNGPILCAVDALRGEWHVRALQRRGDDWPRALDQTTTVPAGAPPAIPVDAIIGFGIGTAWSAAGVAVPALEPPALAPRVAVRLSRGDGPAWWDEPVTRPLYLRAPAVTTPRPR